MLYGFRKLGRYGLEGAAAGGRAGEALDAEDDDHGGDGHGFTHRAHAPLTEVGVRGVVEKLGYFLMVKVGAALLNELTGHRVTGD